MSLIRGLLVSVVLFALAGVTSSARAQTPSAGMAHTDSTAHSLIINLNDLKWIRMFPELGDKSSEISILHEDPKTHATQLLIRVPKDFHVPMHWHSANETHTLIQGTFVMECEGKRVALNAGGFNYMPARMRHEAWTTPAQGALLFITVDSAWDINWVNGTPRGADFLGGQPAPKP